MYKKIHIAELTEFLLVSYFNTFVISLCHFQLYFRCILTPSPGRISTHIVVSSHRANEYEALGNFTQERKKEILY